MKDKVTSDSHHYTISPIWLSPLKDPGDNQGAVVVHPVLQWNQTLMDGQVGEKTGALLWAVASSLISRRWWTGVEYLGVGSGSNAV